MSALMFNSFELMDTQRQIQLMKKMEYMKVDGIITMGDPNNEDSQ